MTVRIGKKERDDPQLRAEAEARLAAGRAQRASSKEQPVEELVHELQVNRIELEMQNETLRQSQIALEEARDRYIDFYDFAPVGYLTLSDKGLIVEVNLTGSEMLGMDRTKLLRRRFGQSIVAADRDRWNMHFTSALGSDTSLNCEITLSRPNGSRIDVRLDSLCMVREGHAPSVRSVLTDITQRKNVEDDLKASQLRFQHIVNTTEGIVWEADAMTFDCSFVSRQAERLLGYPAEDWLQSGFWLEHLHSDDRAWVPDYCAARTREMQPYDIEYRFIACDGRTVWFRDIVTVAVEDGRPRWLRGIMVDVTRSKAAEQQLREMAASLEAKVEERTRQLRRLSAQLTMTEERERRMLAEDLHDNLGQLLAVIKIKLTTLAAGPLPSAVDEVVGLVDQAERSARSITMELSPPILHRLGLMPALEWLGDEMERVYGIVVRIHGGLCDTPLGPEIQAVLYRSVRELLINVAKHAGVCEASVSCLCTDDRLALVVDDEGCGFDPAGHGGALSGQRSFGLSSIYERMVNLGGAMEVDSSPGNGSTITLTVPCPTV